MEASSRRTRELVERAKSGDLVAYESLFGTYSSRLESLIERRLSDDLRDKVEARDVLQETYLEAARHFGSFRYDKPGSLYAWLSRIALNKMREMYRHFCQRKKRGGGRSRAKSDFAPGTGTTVLSRHAGTGTTPTAAARRGEATEELARRLARLPREYRLAISLVRIEERSMAEAASALGRTQNAVKKLLARALAALRKEFERDGMSNPLD